MPHFRLLTAVLACAGTAFAAAADSDPLEGTWAGTVTAPQGEAAGIGFEFRRDPAGMLGFALYFPAMFTAGADLGIPVERTGPGRYTIGGPFPTTLELAGDRLTGRFTAANLPLNLARGAPLPQPLAFPAAPAGPAPLWRYALDAGTWAPPVVDAGIIFVGGGDGRFHAVQAKDGTRLWTWTGPHPIDGRAVVDDGSVYFIDTHFDLVALDRHNGVLRWRTPLYNEFLARRSLPDNPTFNHRSAIPLLHDGVLYAGSADGGLYALNPATGARLWCHDARAPVFSGVGLRDADTLMFGTMDGSVVLLDRQTHEEIRRMKTGGGVVTTPVIAGNRLVVGSRDYLIHAFDPADGTDAWKFSYWFSWVESTPVLRDGLLYVGGSDYARVTALEPATGRARWSTVVHGMTWGSPLVTDRHVFAGTVNQNLPGTLIPHEAGLAKLDRATGEIIWRIKLPAAPPGKFAGYAGSLALAGDKVIAAGFDGFLVAYPAE
jgi:outer membrane protein assembly factor BamB